MGFTVIKPFWDTDLTDNTGQGRILKRLFRNFRVIRVQESRQLLKTQKRKETCVHAGMGVSTITTN